MKLIEYGPWTRIEKNIATRIGPITFYTIFAWEPGYWTHAQITKKYPNHGSIFYYKHQSTQPIKCE